MLSYMPARPTKLVLGTLETCLNQLWIAQVDYVFALLIPHSLQLCCIEN